MKRKRFRPSLLLSEVPVTPIVDAGRPSLKKFQAEEAAREAREKEQAEAAERARLDEASRPLREAAREASNRIRAYWSQPLQEIKTNGPELSPVDLFGDYTTDQQVVAEGEPWNEFNAYLTSRGVTLYRGGLLRLEAYMQSLEYHRGVALTSVFNWNLGLSRLASLKCFEPHELEGYQPPIPQTTPAPAPERPVDPLAEIETLDLSSRTGSARAKEIATNDFFGRQMAPIADRWRSWLLATFNYVLTSKATKAAGEWWERNPTASPLTASSWTQLRLNLVKRGVMPSTCLLPDELLDREIEASSERSDSYEARRNLKQRIRELATK